MICSVQNFIICFSFSSLVRQVWPRFVITVRNSLMSIVLKLDWGFQTNSYPSPFVSNWSNASLNSFFCSFEKFLWICQSNFQQSVLLPLPWFSVSENRINEPYSKFNELVRRRGVALQVDFYIKDYDRSGQKTANYNTLFDTLSKGIQQYLWMIDV